MKKMFKVIATVAAILSMANFVACKSDDDDDDSTVAVTSVTLDKTEASIAVGASVTLTATVAPTNATNAEVSWGSSDTTIATVKDGTVTGVAEGTATITATAGGKKAEATITVTAASTDSGSTDTDGSGDSSTDTTTSKTATLAYDGSAEENVPAESGDTGVFTSVETALADAGVVTDYDLDEGYPKYGSQSYTGDDSATTTSSGILIVSSLKDGNTKLPFTADITMAYATYKFTLSSAADVVASVEAFNTQSSALAGKLEIIDSSDAVKTTKTGSGSKSANGVTADSVSLDAGEYTLKFSWVLTKDTTLKKVNCGISAFSIAATTK